ncbi:hypothetical protein ABOM_007874 [Aspergillus bombycis]|uniref:LysR family regulatory protein n=1 Tax=Aspergillus bombycis TaxID=109264 RepID=A0A1F7ZSA8_9EURO|nr:hypothetical protein ABOM_007874 [Aspergillus bombycis]OGM42336.1 hypothetical protein ABOM_007874 [Aspergillus bombycis]
MNYVREWLLGAKGKGEPITGVKPSVDEPDMYPVHPVDHIKDCQTFVAMVMVFNDALDADMLSDSLSKLLEIGDWRKLGGRLKRDADGRLQIQVPPEFTAEQPAITYTHICLTEMKISDHPIAKQLPTRTGDPSMQTLPDSAEFRTLQVRNDFPTSLDALIAADLPQISLHIHSFHDATVVGFAWSHTLMDGIGWAALLRNWSLVMAGQVEKVPPVAGARHDILSYLPPSDSDQEKLFPSHLRNLRLAKFICRLGWEKLTGPTKVFRAMYMPKVKYDLLVNRAKDQVSRIATDVNKKLYISEVDALIAWVTQQVALSQPTPRPVTIMSIINYRYRLKELLRLDDVYMQNMLMLSYTLLSAQEARGAVAPLALSHRAQVMEQTTEPRVASFVQWLGKQIDTGKSVVRFCGEPDSTMIWLNSFTKSEIIKVTDFAPAVVRVGEDGETRRNPRGTMVNFFFKDPNEPVPSLDALYILAKDHSGGTWLQGNFSVQVWDALEQQMKLLVQEG